MLELTGDLTVKERELKVLKFKTLFDTPAREKRTHGGSFAANSARTAQLGRSITKTSDDFKKMPLLEILPHARNGKLESTLKHRRVGSNLSSSIIVDGELNQRRKTVGFREASFHRKLTITPKQDLDESKPAESAAENNEMIAVDDVDSKHSNPLFDNAEDISKNQLS